MQFQDLLLRYFGTTDLDAVDPAALGAGIEHMRVDFGMATDERHKFGLWTTLYMLGAAPDLDAFKDLAIRDAARNFMDLADGMSEGDD